MTEAGPSRVIPYQEDERVDGTGTIPTAQGQETIQMMDWPTLLDDLDRMVGQARKRNDPTIAISLSIETVDYLVGLARQASGPATLDPARLARAIADTRIDADASPEEAAAALIATYEENSNG